MLPAALALALLLGGPGAAAVPISGNGTVHRMLQAGVPDKCSEQASFDAWLAAVNSACCAKASSACENGLPSSCALPSYSTL